MSMYRITATADAVIGDDEFVTSSYDIPQFLVNGYTASEEEAKRVAKDIIDPLHITNVHIKAERVPDTVRENDVAAVRAALVTAVGALNGPDSDAEHPAFFGLADAVATLLGVDLVDLLETGEEDDDA